MSYEAAGDRLNQGNENLSPLSSPARIRGLDGLRGICIILVSISHFVVARNSPFPEWFKAARFLGEPAVDVFFVISGFLITSLLLREADTCGGISLGRFYGRRALRILPAYVAFLITSAALQRWGIARLDPKGWALALTYTVSLVPHQYSWIGHVWSLSVEEHFYLLWPLILFFLPPKRALYILGLSIIAASVLRVAIFYSPARDLVDLDLLTLTRMDTIAVGCLLAFATRDDRSIPVFEMLRRWPTATVLISISLVGATRQWLGQSAKYDLIVMRPFEAVLFALIVAAGVSNNQSVVGRCLTSTPLVAIGVLSYSLYIWQPFLHPASDAWQFSWPVNIACALGCAVVSYFCVERPCLRLKRVFAQVALSEREPVAEPAV
ncbi:MAG TPA: acyltransferase [Pirellulales bacterium]|nr:acyltransferase [Pirellulales bacterium]